MRRRRIDWSGQNLSGKSLRGEDLSHANLKGAILYGADLSYASLYGADLTGVRVDESTNWYGADLRKTINVPYIPMVCPSHGAFIGWKQAKAWHPDPVLVKLLILCDSRRVSGTTRSCRCDKALVLAIEGTDKAHSMNDDNTWYKVGHHVFADSFTADRWDNYGHGLYFFIDREEAVNYRWT